MDSYSQINGQSDGGGTQHVYDSLTQQFYPISTQSLADAPQPETNNLSWYESLDSAYLTGNDLYAADSSFAQQQARGSQQVQEVSYSQPAFLQPQVPQALNIDPAAAAAIYKAQVPIGPKRTSASEARSGRISLPEHKIRLPKEGPESLAPAIDLSHRRSQSFTALPTPDDNDFTRATGMAPALTRTLTKPTPMGPPIAPSLLSRRADAFNKKAAARKSIDSVPASPSSPTGSGRMNEDPAYDYYGSSFVGFNAPTSGRAMPDPSTFVPLAEKSPTPEPFDPVALGLPQPPNPVPGQAQNRKGLYSSSGFDMLGVLARVVQRSNPEIELGPIDAACSFVIVDARKFDQPIVYASENFSRLTGYSNAEILGQNCRFLQSPDALVPAGSKRKYTDSHACFHMKKHIMTGRETQASLINYCKGGRPFINLVTIIPITWDSSEIAYYVGFQVDLVDQPTAILEKMKNGTYIVNYSVLGQSMPKTVSADRTYSIEAPSSYDMEQSRSRADSIVGLDATPSAETPVHVDSATTASNPSKLIDSVVNGATLTSASSKKWQKLVLEHCDDFMHVLSIKGTFLYVSPSTARLLEYEVDELIGKTLASICHPSDVVAVLRELKEAGSVNRPKVSLLYRVQRKRSGYQWMECQGKMHVESGKNRKSVVLVGRPREVYKMSWKDLDLAGGLVEREFWSKMTMDGQLLYTTPNVKKIIGMTSSELLGSRFSKLLPEEEEAAKHAEILTAIGQSSRGQLSNVRHKIRGRSGVIDVSTNFYPSESTDEIEALDPLAPPASPPRQYTAIVQTSVCSDNAAARPKAPLPSQSQRSKAPGSSRSFSSTGSDSPTPSSLFSGNGSSSSSGYHSPASSWSLQSIPRKLADGETSDAQSSNSSGSSFSAIPSTYKTLQDPVNRRDNVFDELVTTRGTSWQFELHQLKLTNRRLREEKEALAALQQRKRRHINMLDTPPVPGAPRSCANCGRTGSPEWRMGPTGPKTLCNACGLRWSKAKSTGASTPSETATTPRPAASAGAPSPLGLTSVASPRIQRPAFFSIPSELTKSFEQSNLGS